MRGLRRLSLSVRVIALALLAAVTAVGMTLLLLRWLPAWAAAALGVSSALVTAAVIAWQALARVRALFRALAGTVAAYRDGDFSFGIHWDGAADLAELVAAHNTLGDALREQRQDLVQRELLLDSVLQNTPVALLLLDPARRVVLANLAARRVFGQGRRLEGHAFADLLAQVSPAIGTALERGDDSIFTVGEEEDIFHLSCRRLRLNGRVHELLLLRQLTAELRRQEVQTWKKVIRVISHELNNSLGPVASLARSGEEMLRRNQLERLPQVLETIGERARHLDGFLQEYARLARLPAPRCETVRWPEFIARLQSQSGFSLDAPIPEASACFDPAQIEQALLNLLKNAHESGSAPDAVALRVRRGQAGWEIEVLDRGGGMSESALANALLPFYSTKRSGTGLGLALAREIIEAHGGRIGLANRPEGGVRVSLGLPDPGRDGRGELTGRG